MRNYKTILIAILSVFFMCCGLSSDKYLMFKEELAQEAIDLCLTENPKLSSEQCNLKNCLSNEFIMHGMDELFTTTIEVMNDAKIDYWLDAGTLLGALRFGAHMPWDDDVDFETKASDFNPHTLSLQKKFAAKGLLMLPAPGDFSNTFSGTIGYWQILYTKSKYEQLLLKVKPDLSFDEIDALWSKYTNLGELPHLDIFPMYENNGTWDIKVSESVFPRKGTFYTDTIFPLKQMEFLGQQVNVPNDIEKYLDVWYGTKGTALTDFVMKSNHIPKCSTAVRLKDARKNPKYLDYIENYLKYIYGNKFKAINPELRK